MPDVVAASRARRTALLEWLLFAVACLLNTPPVAHANSIVVTSKLDLPDPGKCRLRDAIIAANTHAPSGDCAAGVAGLDTISFSFANCAVIACTITLGSTLPDVTEDLKIDGSAGGGRVTISGANQFRVFFLPAGNITLTNLVVINGRSAAISMKGANLTLSNSRMTGNQGSHGGAIGKEAGRLVIVNSVFENNSGVNTSGAVEETEGLTTILNSTFRNNHSQLGGAVSADGGNLIVSGSVFDGNTAERGGGAIYLTSTSQWHATIESSTLSNNQVVSATVPMGEGGGALLLRGNSVLTLTTSTLSNNLSNLAGGGMLMLGGLVTVTNVTLSGNAANASGGGIAVAQSNPLAAAALTLNNVTQTGNTADADNDGSGNGGGMAVLTGTVNTLNSIVGGNFDTPGNTGAGLIHPDCSGVFAVAQYNLIGRNDGCAGFVNGVNGNRVGTAGSALAVLLAPLANHGGATLTHALLAGSLAFDAANPAPPGSGGLACAPTDQRGITRPLGAVCDIGAYEALPFLFLPMVQR